MALNATGLCKAYAGPPVLDELDWRVPTGTVCGLLGRNGAGKSTLLRCLIGLSRPDSGEVELLGSQSGSLPDEIRERLGYVPQSSRDFSWMNVEDVLQYVGSFYRSWDEDRVADLAMRWALPMAQPLGSLSEGQRQKVSILRALGHNPDLLILDEPVAALDPIARRAFISELLEVAFDEKRTVVFSTHITSDLERIAADVALLKDGEIAWHGALDKLKEQVVRLRIGGPGADRIELPEALSLRRAGEGTVATVRDFGPERLKELTSGEQTVAVERLNLEEIFMELEQ